MASRSASSAARRAPPRRAVWRDPLPPPDAPPRGLRRRPLLRRALGRFASSRLVLGGLALGEPGIAGRDDFLARLRRSARSGFSAIALARSNRAFFASRAALRRSAKSGVLMARFLPGRAVLSRAKIATSGARRSAYRRAADRRRLSRRWRRAAAAAVHRERRWRHDTAKDAGHDQDRLQADGRGARAGGTGAQHGARRAGRVRVRGDFRPFLPLARASRGIRRSPGPCSAPPPRRQARSG